MSLELKQSCSKRGKGSSRRSGNQDFSHAVVWGATGIMPFCFWGGFKRGALYATNLYKHNNKKKEVRTWRAKQGFEKDSTATCKNWFSPRTSPNTAHVFTQIMTLLCRIPRSKECAHVVRRLASTCRRHLRLDKDDRQTSYMSGQVGCRPRFSKQTISCPGKPCRR